MGVKVQVSDSAADTSDWPVMQLAIVRSTPTLGSVGKSISETNERGGTMRANIL